MTITTHSNARMAAAASLSQHAPAGFAHVTAQQQHDRLAEKPRNKVGSKNES